MASLGYNPLMFDLGATDPAEKHAAQIKAVAQALRWAPSRVLTEALRADPTEYKIYVGWILKQMKFKNIRLPEDNPRIRELLMELDEAKRVRPPGIELDINKYRTIHDLSEAMDGMLEMYSNRELERPQEIEDFPTGVTLHAESQNYRILEITDPEACVLLGRGTKWCTRDSAVAEQYISRYGYLYLILARRGERWVVYGQYTPDYSQIMDTKDRSLMIEDIELVDLMGPNVDPPEGHAHAAYRYALEVLNSRWEKGEEAILTEPLIAVQYAKQVIKGRWPEGEAAIAQNAEASFEYARGVIRGRWAPGEPAIAQDVRLAYTYANEILNGRFPLGEETIVLNPGFALVYLTNILHESRWPEAEPAIAEHPEYALSYARNFVHGPWPPGEAAIARDPSTSIRYAREVLHGRFPEGEAAIASDADAALAYALQVLNGPYPEFEPAISKDARRAYIYAQDVLGGRFPEGEAAIAKEPQWAYFYARDVIRGRWPEGEETLRKNKYWMKEYEELFEG
jgi:hypothetical protein